MNYKVGFTVCVESLGKKGFFFYRILEVDYINYKLKLETICLELSIHYIDSVLFNTFNALLSTYKYRVVDTEEWLTVKLQS